MRYRVVRPWRPHDKAGQSTVVTERDTIEGAFEEIDRLSEQMVMSGAPSNYVELIVVDEQGRMVPRPNAC